MLDSKEGVRCMALFAGNLVLGGAEGSLYIAHQQTGELIDVRTKAHPSAVTALLSIGTQLWSGSEDGTLHTWEMKVCGKRLAHSSLTVLCIGT